MKISKNRDLATKKKVIEKKKVFRKKNIFVENSIRAIRNAILDPCTPLGPGEPFSRNLQIFRLSAYIWLQQMVIHCSSTHVHVVVRSQVIWKMLKKVKYFFRN